MNKPTFDSKRSIFDFANHFGSRHLEVCEACVLFSHFFLNMLNGGQFQNESLGVTLDEEGYKHVPEKVDRLVYHLTSVLQLRKTVELDDEIYKFRYNTVDDIALVACIAAARPTTWRYTDGPPSAELRLEISECPFLFAAHTQFRWQQAPKLGQPILPQCSWCGFPTYGTCPRRCLKPSAILLGDTRNVALCHNCAIDRDSKCRCCIESRHTPKINKQPLAMQLALTTWFGDEVVRNAEAFWNNM